MEPKYGICVRGEMEAQLFRTRELAADERLHLLDTTSLDQDETEVVAVIDPQRMGELLDALGIAVDETERWLESLFSEEEEKTANTRIAWLTELEKYFKGYE